MATMDIFSNKAFSQTELALAFEKMPYQPNFMQSLGITTSRALRTKTMAIEKKDGKLSLIQTSERGAPLEQGEAVKRDIRDFRTVRVAKGDTIYADEIQDIRAFGSESELKQVQREVAERMNQLEVDHNLTEENMLLGMVQGKVLDADDSVIYDWFAEWGVTQPTEIAFDIANTDLPALRTKILALQRRMARNAKGIPWSGQIGTLCGDNFYDALTTSPLIEAFFMNQQEAKARREDDGGAFSSFRFAGVNWFNYRGTDDNSTVSVASDEVKFFPMGARGAFIEARSPGESMSMVNRPGRRRYPMIVRDRDRDMWVKPELYTYPIFCCLRPEMLERGKVGA